MTAPNIHQQVIDAYVADVVGQLPRRQRKDVALELRALLADELLGQARESGRLADEEMALDLVRKFGRPDDVAARYHPPGAVIIPSSQTGRFLWVSLLGVALQWAISLTLLPQMDGADAARFGIWWVSYGLGALWWPGFLVVVATFAALFRQRWPATHSPWLPKSLERDEIDRPLHALGLGAAFLGVGIWVALAWLETSLFTGGLADVFRFSDGFLETGGLLLLLYWIATLVLMVIVLVEGRWRQLTRRIRTSFDISGAAILIGLAIGGPIFVSEETNAPLKLGLVIITGCVIIGLAWRLWRSRFGYLRYFRPTPGR